MDYTVNFYPEKRRGTDGKLIEKNVAINLFFSYDGKRLQYYTGQRIDLKKWDPNVQRVKRGNVNAKGHTSSDINEVLTDIEGLIVKVYKESKALGFSPTVDYLREQLRERLIKDNIKTAPKEKEVAFFQLFDQFIEKQKQDYSHGYIKQLKSTKQHFLNFAAKKNIRLTYSGIDENIYYRFKEYFLQDLDNTDNSFAGTMKRFKKFMRWATELPGTKKKNYEWMKFEASEKYESKVIFLTWAEFMQLYNTKLENEHLQKVRDIFIFQSMTAMRYDDLYNLRMENFKDDGIEYVQGKTGKVVKVPYNEFTLEIIERYKGLDRPLPRMTNQPFNVSLKELFKEAKLNRKVQIVKFRKGEPIEEFKPLHEIAASHMARRNFIGIGMEKKIKTEVIKSISGHVKDSKAFGRYYEVSDELKAEAMNSFKK